MASRVTDRDRGYKALKKRIFGANSPTVTVGIHGDVGGAPAGGGNTTVGDVASIHEFGIGHHPERSFIRAWADAEKSAHNALLRKLAEGVVRGPDTALRALAKAGVMLEADAQKFIQSNRVQPATAKKDPQDNPTTLIATGQLVGSITHKVEP